MTQSVGHRLTSRDIVKINTSTNRPYGVMVSHQLDVLRVPGSIPGEANFLLVFFFSDGGLNLLG